MIYTLWQTNIVLENGNLVRWFIKKKNDFRLYTYYR